MAFPRDTNKSFIKKAQNKWGDRYNYDFVNYVNSRTPIAIVCNKHMSKFEQTPKAHFAAKHHCCPRCYQEVIGTYQNKWRMNNRSATIGGGTIEYSSIIEAVFRSIEEH